MVRYNEKLIQVKFLLLDCLLAEWVHFPANEQARRAVSDGFLEKFAVPSVLGAVNCTHIKTFIFIFISSLTAKY